MIKEMSAGNDHKRTLMSLSKLSELFCAAWAVANSERSLVTCSDEEDAAAADSATELV